MKKKILLLLLPALAFCFTAEAQVVNQGACFGDTLCLTLSGYFGDIQWERSPDMNTWADVNGATDDTLCLFADSTNAMYYRAEVTDGTCDSVYSDTFRLSVSYLTIDAGTDKGICTDSVTLGGAPTASNGHAPYTYDWSPTTGLSNATVANPKAFVTAPTTYILMVTDSVGCTLTDTAQVDTGATVVLNETFTGSSVFTGVAYPYGDPNDCGYPDCVNFSNNGNADVVNLCCYDEGELRYSPNLPNSSYEIELTWSTGVDPHEYTGATYTNYDDQYGGGIDVPSRLIVINGNVEFELSGKQSNLNTVTTISYTGAINDIYLSVSSAGSATQYFTYFDNLVITECK